MKRRPFILIAAIAVVSLCLTAWHYWDGIAAFVDPASNDMSAYTEVDATIKSVYASGKDYRRATIMTVSYEYEGVSYSATVRLPGYEDGRYNAGDTIKRYLDPAKPGELIE